MRTFGRVAKADPVGEALVALRSSARDQFSVFPITCDYQIVTDYSIWRSRWRELTQHAFPITRDHLITYDHQIVTDYPIRLSSGGAGL